jgi:hypothetical protein
MKLFSGLLVGCFGIFLIGLAVTGAFLPLKAGRFLEMFASSQRAHLLEQFLRLVVGAALIIFASEMWFSDLFNIFGWVIVVTTIILLLLPWRLHQRFSELTIPQVKRHLKLFALGAFALATFIFYGMSRVYFS